MENHIFKSELFGYFNAPVNEVPRIRIWSAENSSGEIDFLLQCDDKVIPVEVKAEENLRAKSLRLFVSGHDLMHGVRLSMSPYREQDWMTNFPLCAAGVFF